MSIIAKKSENEGNFKPIDAGTYQAVCYAVWDIGNQLNPRYNKVYPKVIIAWEIDKRIETEGEYKNKRFVVSNTYTLSLGDKAILRQHLESWRGKPFTEDELKGFDLSKLIGINCLINIVHKKSADGTKTYTNISSVMKCTEGMTKLTPEIPKDPPEWVQNKIKNQVRENEQNTDTENDVPFDPPNDDGSDPFFQDEDGKPIT